MAPAMGGTATMAMTAHHVILGRTVVRKALISMGHKTATHFRCCTPAGLHLANRSAEYHARMNAGRPTYQSFRLGDWQATAPLSHRYSASSTRYFEPVKTNSAIASSDSLHYGMPCQK